MAHGMMDLSSPVNMRRHLEHLKSQLKTERATFEKTWRDVNDYIRPRRARFFVQDVNKGDRRNRKIIDSTGTFASRTLAAGLMAGVSSPARPWFMLGSFNTTDQESEEDKIWLHKTSMKMRSGFLRTNLYNVLPITYGDMADFATGCMFVEEDLENIAHFYSFPIGSYMIGKDGKGRINTFVREFQMTVRQVVETFGMDPENPGKEMLHNISDQVQSYWKNGNTEAWINITHVVMPNSRYNPNLLDSKYKRFASIYYEQGDSSSSGSNTTGTVPDKILSEKGYDYFPVLCPRWSVTGEDVYGTNSPGIMAIGGIKQLQHGEKKSLMAVDKQLDPPMTAPDTMKSKKASILPGDITYLNASEEQRGGFKPAYQVQFDVNSMEMKQEQVRKRISRAYYEDLILMLSSIKERQKTATESELLHEEKLLGFGPVLVQMKDDIFDPLIDIMFDIMYKQGHFDEPPQSLVGEDLRVDYISPMAQVQKTIGLGSLNTFSGFVGQWASIDPGVLDKVNRDRLIDEYGEMSSVPPGVIHSDEDANAIRQEREMRQQQMQQAEKAQMMANTAKQLGDTNTQDKNALTDLLGTGEGGEQVAV